MALYNLIGRRRRHDVTDAVPLLAEKLRVNVLALILDFSSTFRLSECKYKQ